MYSLLLLFNSLKNFIWMGNFVFKRNMCFVFLSRRVFSFFLLVVIVWVNVNFVMVFCLLSKYCNFMLFCFFWSKVCNVGCFFSSFWSEVVKVFCFFVLFIIIFMKNGILYVVVLFINLFMNNKCFCDKDISGFLICNVVSLDVVFLLVVCFVV